MTIMLENTDYSHIRGFNYQPSYASNGIESWITKFDFETADSELGYGKKHFPHINTIRLWLSPDAFVNDSQAFCKNFDKIMSLADKYDIKFIVTLYNFWHSIPDFGGVSVNQLSMLTRKYHEVVWRDYLEKIVGKYATDARVLLWDLCNEPLAGQISDEGKTMIVEWLDWVRKQCKSLGATAPICVGSIPNMPVIELLEPVCDILTIHPYFAYNGWVPTKQDYTDFLDQAVAFANKKKKAMISTECCWGSNDDKHRGEIIEFELSEQSKRGMGIIPHLMYESRVADAHRNDWGPVSTPGYMAFINRDGELRPHHDVFNKYQ